VTKPVVVLAGGTGGAKLARGMLGAVGPGDLVVIANTGDDVEIYGAYVSPDPDLVTFWLADRIDERGWGLAGDTFHVMEGLRQIGVETWFQLGDQDLAIGLSRAQMMAAGARLTDVIAKLARALGVGARVLPMSDKPVRTRVMAEGHWWPFQEFMIKERTRGSVEAVDFRGARSAPATPEVLSAIADARAIVIGPSNPVVSIGPILAVGGVRDALRDSPASVVAVSPLVHGDVVKGPTEPPGTQG
jgi:LPPG:FO 2-phospho-L-lactate transferase